MPVRLWQKYLQNAQELESLLPSVQSRPRVYNGLVNFIHQQREASKTWRCATSFDHDDTEPQAPEAPALLYLPVPTAKTTREISLDMDALHAVLPSVERPQVQLLLVALEQRLQG